jgi:hypothetical protein
MEGLKVVVRGSEVWIADGSEAKGKPGFFRVHGNCADDVFLKYTRARSSCWLQLKRAAACS